MLALGFKRPRKPQVDGFPQVFFFKKLTFMLNVTSKSENDPFLITRIREFTETWVVTQRDIKGHLKSH